MAAVTEAMAPEAGAKPRAMTPAEKRAAKARRMLEGPVLPMLVALAVPNIVVMSLQTGVSILEQWYIGHLGTQALASATLVFPFFMLMQMMSAGAMGGGVSAAVARSLGAGKVEDAERLIVHAILIALGGATLFCGVMLGLGGVIFAALGGRGEVLAGAVAYALPTFVGAYSVWLLHILSNIVRGTGNMIVPAIVLFITTTLQMPLAGAFAFGWGPFPELGLAGTQTGIATGFTIGAILIAAYLASGATGLRFRLLVPLEGRLFWEILKVGLIACLSAIFTTLTVMLVTAIVGQNFGREAIAAYGIGNRLEFMLIPLAFGIGSALTAMVGTNVGAGQIQRAERIAWIGASAALVLTASVGAAAALYPSAWIGLFSADPAVHAAGGIYLTTVGPFFGLFGLGMALYFASQGAGRMLWPVGSGATRTLVAIAGGWALVTFHGGGLWEVFAMVALGMFLFGVVIAGSVWAGAWRTGR